MSGAASAPLILAHGVGTRSDLPVPLSYAAAGAGLAVLVSFVALALLWKTPRLDAGRAGIPLPGPVRRLLDAPPLRLALRTLATAVSVVIALAGLLGPADVARNIAPWAFFVTFWVGLVAVSLVLGPVWRALNPLRAVHATLARLTGTDPDTGSFELPAWVGFWPAAVSLYAFAWFELVSPNRSNPRHVATFILVYAAVHVVAGLWFGRRWFDRGDGFEVYSTLLGRLAPLGRRADGRLVVRNPLQGLDGVEPAPGLVAVVATLVGSTAYDGLSRTQWWFDRAPTGVPVESMILLGVIVAVGLLFTGAGRLAAQAGDPGRLPAVPAEFAHSIVPIAAGYAIAHYFSLLMFDGQQTFILASDPFGTGLNLFGTANDALDYTVVGVTTIAVVQVAAIVVGHVLAVFSAHDRAVRLFPALAVVRSQLPLLAVMIAFTVGAVLLVFAA